MKNLVSNALVVAAIGVMLLLGLGHATISAQAVRSGSNLIGVWQTSVIPRNCGTGAQLAPAFPGILAFSQGGTMTGTSTAVTSVYGVWDRQGGAPNQFYFVAVSLRYSATGILLGTRKITQTVKIGDDPDSFTSDGGFLDTDTSGVTVNTGCSTSTGSRLQL